MEISQAIKELIGALPALERTLLKKASFDLSSRYRNASYEKKALSKLERYAYLLARLPATKAATTAVLLELEQRWPDFKPLSLADIGAGPATASWAAKEQWPSLNEFSFLEKDGDWIKVGQQLAKYEPLLTNGTWIEQDLLKPLTLKAADLIIAAYSFQELPCEYFEKIATELFLNTRQALVIIEPGTPKGFNNLRLLRELLIKEGALILAPCTHEKLCPIDKDGWCHFSTRLLRDQAHRHLKDASVAFEDEKYAYLIVTREITKPLFGRVIRSPIKRSGHIIVDLCSKQGITREITPRSSKAAFKEVKNLSWGSPIIRPDLAIGQMTDGEDIT